MFVNKTPRLTQMAWNFIIGADWLFIWADSRYSVRLMNYWDQTKPPKYWGRFKMYCSQFSKLLVSITPPVIGANLVCIVADVPNFHWFLSSKLPKYWGWFSAYCSWCSELLLIFNLYYCSLCINYWGQTVNLL